MNKSELLESISQKMEGQADTKTINRVLQAFQETVTDSLAHGDRVTIPGFGTFESRTRQARKGMNPKTKERIDIPASTGPAFKPGSEFKKRVAEAHAH